MQRIAFLLVYLFSFGVAPHVDGLRSIKNQFTILPFEPAAPVDELVKPDLPKGQHWVPVLKLNAEVDGTIVANLQHQIESANRKGAEAIVLQLDTPGGSIWNGLELIKTMEDSKIPIICVVDTLAASMGDVILQDTGCTERFMTPRSILMLHTASSAVQGQEDDFKNMEARIRALNETTLWIQASRMKVSVNYVRDKISHSQEWWITYKEAAEVGAVDGVVYSVKDVVESYTKTMKAPTKQVH